MRRLEFVDSLRGLAAIYVAIYHTVLIPRPNLAVPHWAGAIALSGGSAVTLFFVVSAFSLCQTMRDRHGEPHELLAFFIRRFFRIAPLFYAMIVFTFIRDWTYFGVVHGFWECVKSALFIFNLFPGSELGFVWASWTIGVEMLFYAFFPILFSRFPRLEEIAAIFFASLLGAVLYHELVAHLPLPEATRDSFYSFGFLRHLPVFVFGMLTWKVFVTHVQDRVWRSSVGTALILMSAWAYHAVLHGALNIWFTDAYYWQAVIYSALLIGLAVNPSRLVVNGATQLFGRISYSIYLLHPPVVLFLTPVYRRVEAIGVPVSLQFVLCVGLTLAAVVVLASISYRWIEKPGMRLGNRLLLHLCPALPPAGLLRRTVSSEQLLVNPGDGKT